MRWMLLVLPLASACLVVQKPAPEPEPEVDVATEPEVEPAPAPAAPPADSPEARMLELVNEERQERDLEPLAWNPELAALAEAHSEDMLARDYLAHVGPDGRDLTDRARRAGVDYRRIAENVGFAPTVEGSHEGLMASPTHRANLLDPELEQIGIGIVEVPGGGDFRPGEPEQLPGGFGGYVLVTQVFRG